ncbi:MAG: pyridoxal phosphate-dependent aminotransferase [Gemmatimonadetes bacterium]|nr:pyridoxal phosphate-dependent aminotransferase [Gemmatimonadota bacterium]
MRSDVGPARLHPPSCRTWPYPMQRRNHPVSWAPSRTWAKRHAPPRWDLTGSGVEPCALADLPGAVEAMDLLGQNEEGYPPLLRALARRFGVGTDRVITASGATGAGFFAVAALVRPGDKVMVEWPGHDSLSGAVRLLGGEIVDVSREWDGDFAVDPDDLAQRLTHDVRAIVLTNPHDPTGVHMGREALLDLARLADAVGAKVIVDEEHLDALPGVDTTPAALLGDTFVSLNSLSASYGLPGLRLGWMLADPETTERARRVRDVVEGAGPVPVERMGVVAVGQMDRLLARARSILEPNLQLAAAFVEGRSALAWARPAGGPVAFPRLVGGGDADELVRVAREEFEVGVVPGSLFGYGQSFRICLGCRSEVLEGGLEALGKAVDRGTY